MHSWFFVWGGLGACAITVIQHSLCHRQSTEVIVIIFIYRPELLDLINAVYKTETNFQRNNQSAIIATNIVHDETIKNLYIYHYNQIQNKSSSFLYSEYSLM